MRITKVTKVNLEFVAVVFGPGRCCVDLVAPGDADCRWRAVKAIKLAAANDDASEPGESPPADPLAGGR